MLFRKESLFAPPPPVMPDVEAVWDVNEDLLCLATLKACDAVADEDNIRAAWLAKYVLTLVAEVRRLDAKDGVHRKLMNHVALSDGTYYARVDGRYVPVSADSFRD
jgi:hypothetical protein